MTLYNGKHFDSPLVVNKKEGMFRLVDGNHRIEAFKRVLQKYPRFHIDVLLIVYTNLDNDGEIEAFRRWNVGKVQSADDFIQSVADKIPFIHWLKDDFPVRVSIYRRPGCLHLRSLCGALLAAKRFSDIGYGLRRNRFFDDLGELGEPEYNFAKQWIARFLDIFGEPRKGSVYWATTLFNGCTYLAYQHQDRDQEDLDKRFREKVLGNEEILEFGRMSGKEVNRKMIYLLQDKMKLPPKYLPYKPEEQQQAVEVQAQ